MPAWWGKKSSKSKDDSPKKNPNGVDSSVDDGGKGFIDSSGFSGFDSDSAERRGHPLPRPSSMLQNDQIGSASVSASSVSSSGSSDDNQIQFAAPRRSFAGPGNQSEISNISRSRSPVTTGSRRGPTSPTSPLHPRISLESPTGKNEDVGKSQSHRLPLPPGSPTSPTLSSSTTSGFSCETSFYTPSKWRKGRLLGRGTFGHVYLGFNSESGQMCAIKEVTVVSDDLTSKECLKQLNQEINLLSQLHHSNIVRYYGSELGEETLSVYLEYVSGGSIHKLLQEYGSFREPVIQNYTRQILCGLAYLHGRNTVHRDIKGANILVDPNGVIKLADFGMSKHITACSSMLSFKGSPYWMAPEVVMNTGGYSLAVDIWSLGCTILEMATSKPPWSQYEGVAAIFKIGNSKDIPNIPDHLSNDAKSFIRLCLQREPSLRPTAMQLLEHPFVLDLATIRNMKDAFTNSSDGSRSPRSEQPMSELRSNRSLDGDFGTKQPFAVTSKTCMSPTPRDRNAARAMTSLPVSPCSSPLRYGGGGGGATNNSYFLSPPHPAAAYNLAGQSSYNLSEYSAYAATSLYSTRSSLHEISSLRIPTPTTPPRTRPF